jgi:hypothetical protein
MNFSSYLQLLQISLGGLYESLASVCRDSQIEKVPYEQYILAPPSRILHPVSVYNVNGTVRGVESIVRGETGSAIFYNYSAATLDYGQNIAGVVSLQIGEIVGESQAIGIAFSESSVWISGLGSDATAERGIDEIIWLLPSSPGHYSVSREHERGAFRYLSLLHNSTGSVEVKQVSTYFTPMPHYTDNQLRDYTGYFHCDGI